MKIRLKFENYETFGGAEILGLFLIVFSFFGYGAFMGILGLFLICLNHLAVEVKK